MKQKNMKKLKYILLLAVVFSFFFSMVQVSSTSIEETLDSLVVKVLVYLVEEGSITIDSGGNYVILNSPGVSSVIGDSVDYLVVNGFTVEGYTSEYLLDQTLQALMEAEILALDEEGNYVPFKESYHIDFIVERAVYSLYIGGFLNL